MTAMNAARSYALMDDPATATVAEISPSAVLEGAAPRLLDEWQLSPHLWNLVRRRVDTSTEKGLFILTGSAVPADDATRHTGAGRFLRIRERTMTWQEKAAGPVENGVSLRALFDGEVPQTDLSAGLDYGQVVERLLQPGFPALVQLPAARSKRMLLAYIDEVARTDTPRLVEMRHDPAVINQLIAAIARNLASEVEYTTLAKDIRTVAPSITAETVATYVGVLERLFVVERQQAWTPSLRSRARLRTSPRLHLADPALAAVSLGASANRLAADPNTTGFLFESAVYHDLTVFTTALGGTVRHFRDSNGYELDAVLTLPDGRWAAVEVKLGGSQAAVGAQSIAASLKQIDAPQGGDPAFKLVITGTGQTYRMNDGTITCPLHKLMP
jgi:predicted AAA+ superfamily ATPase